MVNTKVKMIMGVCAVLTILLIAKLSTAESIQNMEIQPVSQQEVNYPVVQAAAVSQENTTYTTVEETVVEETSTH